MMASGGRKFKFSRQDRLKRNSDFQRVFDNGRRLRGKMLTIYAIENDKGRSRLGLAVGKSIGNSPKRNRIRRLLREAFRLNRHILPSGFDVVILPAKNWQDFSLSDVEPEIARLFENLVPHSRK